MIDNLLQNPLFTEVAPCTTLSTKPLGFIDIGARGGIHPLVESLAGVIAVMGFEPDREECARMQTELAANSPWAVWDVEPSALAESDGEAILHLLSVPTNHSLLPPNSPLTQRYKMIKFEQVGSFPLHTTSLDKILFSQQHQPDDYWGEFIKLDTQGTEFEILQGARRTLSERTVAIYTEIEFCQVYEGQKLFSEVEIFLREYGFSFYGFATMGSRSCKQLDKRLEAGRERSIWGDAVFFKDPLPGGVQVTPLSVRGNHVLFTCALLLGYYDFALELALATWASGDEAKRIKNLVHFCARLPPSQCYKDTMDLTERVKLNPELANIEVGRFVDQRRHQCDYYDTILRTVF